MVIMEEWLLFTGEVCSYTMLEQISLFLVVLFTDISATRSNSIIMRSIVHFQIQSDIPTTLHNRTTAEDNKPKDSGHRTPSRQII